MLPARGAGSGQRVVLIKEKASAFVEIRKNIHNGVKVGRSQRGDLQSAFISPVRRVLGVTNERAKC